MVPFTLETLKKKKTHAHTDKGTFQATSYE